MADKEVKITIRAVDEFSKAFNKLDDSLSKASKASEKLAGAFDDFANASGSSKLKSMATELATIAIGMQTTAGRAGLAVKGISSLVQAFNKLYTASKQNFVSGLEKLGKVFGTILDGLGSVGRGFVNFLSQVTGADLSIAGLAQTAIGFDETMQRVVQIADRGGKSIGEAYAFLGNKAKQLAIDSQYSTLEIAQGMQEMAQAGMNVQEVYDSMNSVIALSTVGNISLARSAEIVSNGLNAFGMKASEAGDFADALAKVANKTGTNVEQLGQALTNSSSIAGILGIGIEDVTVALGLMGDRFIKGGKAGTAMNNILTRLSAGTGKVNDVIEEFNLQGFKQKVLSGDLVGGLKELCIATEGLEPPQRAMIANTLAGMYGMKGLMAIMDGGVGKIEELEQELGEANGAWDIHNELMNTVQGRLLQVSSIMQVLGGEIFNKLSPALTGALTHLVNFGKSLLDIKQNGDETVISLKSMAQIVNESKKWGTALANGIQKAISSIKGFVTGGSLDNLLTIGTNIIQGICKGISRSKMDLQDTFSALIQKACKFIGDNSEAIGQAGKDILDALANAIRENEDVIKVALDDLMGIVTEWAKGGANVQSAMGLFADSMINAFVDQAIVKATGRGGEIWNAVWSGVTLEDGANIKQGNGSGGFGSMFGKDSPNSFLKFLGKADEGIDTWLKGGITKMAKGVWNWFTGSADACEVSAKEGGKLIGKTTGENAKIALDEQGRPIVESATKTGTESAESIQSALESMDLQYLQALGQEMTNVGTLTGEMATSMNTSFTNIANSARTQFTNFSNIVRNQITNATNAIRTGMLNCTNIVNNQATNMTNAVRTGFVNMSNIVNNQATNMANATRTGFTNMTNIVNNQATNMANSLRTGFTNMTNIVTNQATNMANSIRTGFTNMTNIVKNQATNMANSLRTSFTNMTNIAKNQATNMANAVRTSFTNMSNIAKNQFTNIANSIRTQMTNCTNIVRNQMLNMTNIVKNQTTNMNNAVRTGFVNMANIVRNQMLNCTNIVRNQASNMSSAMSQGLSKMASSAQSAMSRVLSVIRSAMAQARAIASAPITINIKSNVQRKVTTTHVAGGLKQTMANIGANSLSVGTPNVMSASPTHTVNPVSGNGANYVFTIPVSVDGREVARATAKYNQAELDRLSKRNARKRGE